MVNGVIVIDKPEGITSHDVVKRIRKVADQKRVGHVGTLDPIATGVLPLCLGAATRIAQLLQAGRKKYEAVLELGLITDTQDVTGKVLEKRVVPELTETEIETVFDQFRGEIEQVPPSFSAIKHEGTPLYRLARQGREVYRPPRKITVYRLEPLDMSGNCMTFEVECSKGTYVRTLCHDIGLKLGCGATMAALRRTAAEPFDESGAVPLANVTCVEDIAANLIQIDRAIDFVPAVYVSLETARGVLHGQAVAKEMLTGDVPEAGAWVRMYDEDGNFLALGKIVQRDSTIHAHPKRVLTEEMAD
jgi:tRNA pseudouridine55 synthase